MTPIPDSTEHDDIQFLLSCLCNAEKPNFKEVAVLNGMVDTKAVTAQKHACVLVHCPFPYLPSHQTLFSNMSPHTLTRSISSQRKFKKLVDASGKYKLEQGRVVLKDGDAASTTPVTPASTAKKRARGVKKDEVEETPSKKAKRSGKRGNEGGEEDDAGHGMEDSTGDVEDKDEDEGRE